MKKTWKCLRQWLGAILVAAIIMNTVLVFYGKAAGWIDRDSGATLAIYRPNSDMLLSSEGRGYQKIDSRGYVNNVDKLADNYIIAVGSSYTQGREVNTEQRYTDLINARLGYTDEAYVYNVSQIHYFFPELIQGFSALVQEFPDADKIIIETWSTQFAVDELEEALNQRDYDPKQTGANIWSTLSLKRKFTIMVKEYSPLLYNIHCTQLYINQLKVSNDDTSDDAYDLDAYTTVINNIFKLISSKFDGEIILLYHPNLDLTEDGRLQVETHITDKPFMAACKKYGITLVDMTDRFREEYEASYTLPYGFSNTFYGKGHFNAEGHRMVAEELLNVLKSEDE